MQQAVLHHFPDTQATYRFTHRDKDVFFTRKSIEEFKTAVSRKFYFLLNVVINYSNGILPGFSSMKVTDAELQWLKRTCPYFKPRYLDYLSTYEFKPEQVRISFIPVSGGGDFGHVDIEAVGPWVETIMWEVPLMACLSEIYFRLVTTDWIDEGQAGMLISGHGLVVLNSLLLRNRVQEGADSVRSRMYLQ
jgi:nicotinate phosphoribosyltransferase